MELIKCDTTHINSVTSLYHRTIKYLEANINYPKWSPAHRSDRSISGAVMSGDWSKNLNAGEYLVIHALAVDPTLERKGAGRFIVERCIELAKEGGYKALRLDVVPGNIPAERLYQKTGFTFAGTKDLKRNIPEVPVFDLFELNF